MDSKEVATGFAALAQETRVRLLRMLADAGAAGLAAGDLAARLAVPSSTLSFHLAAMEHAGIVQATRQGRQMFYAVRAEGLRRLLAFVAEAAGAHPSDPHSIQAPALAVQPSFNVLFLCTQNSARSIMAEAILRAIGRGRFHAYSAGSRPAAAPNPQVIARLQALGHDTAGLRSKSWNEFAGPRAPLMDFVITLCDTPRGQRCPDFGDAAVRAAWPLPDPARFTGGPTERAALLNELYAGLRRRMEIFCGLPFARLDRMALGRHLGEIAEGRRVVV